jgi:hypothetical protein
MKHFKDERLSWGNYDLVSPGKARARYLAALRKADNGSFGPLINFATNTW